MDLRRLRCVGPCACGGALVVLMVPPLCFILASQAGLVIGWRTAAMPSNILTPPDSEPGAASAEGGAPPPKKSTADAAKKRPSEGALAMAERKEKKLPIYAA